MQADVVAPGVVERLVGDMCRDFDVAAEDVRDLARALYAEFADARVQAFIPVLVERRMREALRAVHHRRRAELTAAGA